MVFINKSPSMDRVKFSLLTLFSVLLFPLMAGTANAHRITVFAWVEGDTVYVEGKFPGGKVVHEGDITVLDPQGNLLLKGKTDEKGQFSFKRPGEGALRIVLDTGTGHRAEWKVPAVEGQSGSKRKSLDNKELRGQRNVGAEEEKSSWGRDTSREEVQITVERALDKKLRPIKKMLAECADSGPDLRDILGGIGYIFGLAGTAAYISSRRTAKKGKDQEGSQ